jgi:hypothetical protein
VSHRNRSREFEEVKDSQHIVTEAIGSVSQGGNAGRAEPATRDVIDAVAGSKLRSELVEHVCGITPACQKNNGRARTAPIKNLQSDILVYVYEFDFVRGWVVPG